MLTDRGILTAQGAIAGDDEIPVPESVQALIAARLDTLPSGRKALLHDAAVVGKVFWAGAVASMGSIDEAAARKGLHELARKELVRPARLSSVEDQAEYAFWHLLVRDVAYGQIPRAARARKHQAAAEWIERMAEGRVTDHAELLAYHYEQAVELARAAGETENAERLEDSARRFLVMAGERARRLDPAKAEAYYRRALALARTELDRARILVAHADVLPGIELSRQELEEALELFRSSDDELGAAETLVEISRAVWLQGHATRSEELLVEATEILERHPPGRELLLAYRRRAGYEAVAGLSYDAVPSAERALALAEELGQAEEVSSLLQYRARPGASSGMSTEACRICVRGSGWPSSTASSRLPAPASAISAHCFSNLGSLVLMAEGPRSALEVYDEGIEFCERRGLTGNRLWLTAERAWVLYDLGRWDELVDSVNQVVKEAIGFDQSFGGGQLSLLALPWTVHVLLRRGETTKATSLTEDFAPRARANFDAQTYSPALAAAALVAQARGEIRGAVALVEELDEGLRDRADWHRARFLPELVAICVAAGELERGRQLVDSIRVTAGRTQHSLVSARAVLAEAHEEWQNALELYEDAAKGWREFGFLLGRAEGLFGAGRCLLALGRPEEAAVRLTDARDMFDELRAEPAVAQIDALLGERPARARA